MREGTQPRNFSHSVTCCCLAASTGPLVAAVTSFSLRMSLLTSSRSWQMELYPRISDERWATLLARVTTWDSRRANRLWTCLQQIYQIYSFLNFFLKFSRHDFDFYLFKISFMFRLKSDLERSADLLTWSHVTCGVYDRLIGVSAGCRRLPEICCWLTRYCVWIQVNTPCLHPAASRSPGTSPLIL